MTMTTWQNWGRTAECTPTGRITPRSVDELAAAVAEAAEKKQTVKPAGAGHSFSEIAVAPGIQVDMSGISGLVDVDAARSRVTLAAGTNLFQIPGLLEPHGLAMQNLGDVDRQTVSGATSTGTHGTGLKYGGISTQIRGVELVDGHGQIHTIGEDDPDLAAAALGLGALGVITKITLQCVDAFAMRAHEAPASADEAVDTFLDRVRTEDHYEFYWFPHTDCALTKTNTRLPAHAEADGPGSVRRYIDDELLSNKVFGMLCGLSARVPAVVPGINQVSGRALSERTFTDRGDQRVHLRPQRPLPRDGVRDPPRSRPRRAPRTARDGRQEASPGQFPGGGARRRRRRPDAVDGHRPAVRLRRRAPLPPRRRAGVHRLLPGRRGHHDRP